MATVTLTLSDLAVAALTDLMADVNVGRAAKNPPLPAFETIDDMILDQQAQQMAPVIEEYNKKALAQTITALSAADLPMRALVAQLIACVDQSVIDQITALLNPNA